MIDNKVSKYGLQSECKGLLSDLGRRKGNLAIQMARVEKELGIETECNELLDELKALGRKVREFQALLDSK